MIELSSLARLVLLGTSTPVATSNTIPANHNPRGRAIWTLRTSHLAGWANSNRSAATGSYRTSGSATCPPEADEEDEGGDDGSEDADVDDEVDVVRCCRRGGPPPEDVPPPKPPPPSSVFFAFIHRPPGMRLLFESTGLSTLYI